MIVVLEGITNGSVGSPESIPELQIRGGIEDNSKLFFIKNI